MTNTEWPERLRLRDTKLHDDLGGAGQRIFTTAGQGYDKREYLLASAVQDALPDQIEIYRAIKESGVRKHGDIAKVIADMLKIKPHNSEPQE